MRRAAARSGPLLLLALALTAGLLWGCDPTVEFADRPPRPFSMWGALTPQEDTQTVKVYPMGTRLEPLPGEALAASLTSEHLESGRVRTWRDSVLREPDGERAHVFWAPFTAERGASYRIEIASARRGTSWAEVSVPERVELEALPARNPQRNPRVFVRIPAAAPQVIPMATLHYLVQIGAADPTSGLTTNEVRTNVPITHPVEETSDGWRLTIPLDEHAVAVESRVGGLRSKYGLTYPGPCCLLDLIRLEAEIKIVNEEWAFPGDSVGRIGVAQPGVISNVQNGFGLVGAGYTRTVHVPVSDTVARAADFRGDF